MSLSWVRGLSERVWNELLKVMDREDLIGDARYRTPADRAARRDEVNAIFAAYCQTRPKHQVMTAVASLGIPCGAVQDTVEVMHDPHLLERGMLTEVHHPVDGVVHHAWLSSAPRRLASAGDRCAAAGSAQCGGLRRGAGLYAGTGAAAQGAWDCIAWVGSLWSMGYDIR